MASGKYVDNISHAASYECLSMFILLQYLLFYMDQGHYFQGFIGSTCLFIPHSKVKVIITRLYWIYLFIYTTFKGIGHTFIHTCTFVNVTQSNMFQVFLVVSRSRSL